MNITSEIKNKLLKTLAVLLVFVLLASSALLLLHFYDKRQGSFPLQETTEFGNKLYYEGQNYVLKNNTETFLVIGLDKFGGSVDNTGYRNDQQADFAVLLVFDKTSSKCTALHINRDTMADVNILGVAGEEIDTVTQQIALAHTYGNGKKVSCRNTATAVSHLLYDVKIDHYLSLTMDSVAIVNDAVGGVELEVLDDFSSIDSALIKGKKVNLKGEQALTYVRTRYNMDDSTNAARMIRQRQYLNELYKKFMSSVKVDDAFIPKLSLKIADYLVSDCSANQLQNIFNKFSNYEFTGIKYFEGESKMGDEFIEFYPDEDSVKKIVIDLFYKLKK